MSWITIIAQLPNSTGTGWQGGVEKTLADWGITSCTREVQNQAQDNVGLNITVPSAIGADPFPWQTKITLMIGRSGTPAAGASQPSSFSGGTTFFVGYRVKNVRSATGRMQAFKYKFTGPWGFFFERHVFQKLWPSWNGTALVLQPRSQVTLGQSVTTITQANGVQTTQQTIAQALIECLNFTLNQTTNQYGTAQFQIDSALPTSNFDGVGGWQGYCPMDAANDLTCAEALKKIVKIIPAVSMWFDYTTTVPTFHVATRDTLPSVTLPWSNQTQSDSPGIYTSTIDRRDDIIPPCVDYKYRITTTVNGETYVQVLDDIACAAGVTNPNTGVTAANLLPFSEYFGSEVATFDFEGGSSTTTRLSTVPIPFNPGTNSYDFALWTQTLVSSLSDASITGVSAAGSATLTYPNGAGADPRYQYFMIGGPVPTGISDSSNPNLPQGVQLTLSCSFTFTEQTPLSGGGYGPVNTKTETKTCSITAFSMPSGNFTNTTQQAEAIPFGLAAMVYNIEVIPQYDGSHGIVEYDPATNRPTITGAVGIGQNLNLSGGLPEYATMNAQVQTIAFDMMTGHSDISFGVASHLGGTEMIERLRINRGPRWLYEISSGPTVNSSAAVSGPVQLKDTQPAASVTSIVFTPTAQTPSESYTTAGALPGGIYQDSGLNTNFSGPAGFGQGQQIVLATGGNSNELIRFGIDPNGQTIVINGNGATINALLTLLAANDEATSQLGLSESQMLIIETPYNATTKNWIRVDVDDILDAVAKHQFFIQEYPICWDFGDGKGVVNAFVQLLGCKPYKTSGG
jgi:hypothetical protein